MKEDYPFSSFVNKVTGIDLTKLLLRIVVWGSFIETLILCLIIIVHSIESIEFSMSPFRVVTVLLAFVLASICFIFWSLWCILLDEMFNLKKYGIMDLYTPEEKPEEKEEEKEAEENPEQIDYSDDNFQFKKKCDWYDDLKEVPKATLARNIKKIYIFGRPICPYCGYNGYQDEHGSTWECQLCNRAYDVRKYKKVRPLNEDLKGKEFSWLQKKWEKRKNKAFVKAMKTGKIKDKQQFRVLYSVANKIWRS